MARERGWSIEVVEGEKYQTCIPVCMARCNRKEDVSSRISVEA